MIDELIGSGASNNWVVSGARTRSGKPLLANDPHLRLGAPAIWYLAHLALEQPGAGVVNVVGATLPGLPLVVLGRSDTLAWGFTNTGPDVQDLFIERINPDNPKEYLTPEGWRPFVVEPMAIAVKDAGVRNLERRRTRHGPVLPGFFRNLEGLLAPGHVAALQWTALSDDDTTVATGMVDAGVRSVDDYMARTRPYVVPMQSMVVADTSGKIGLIAPGRVPVRDPANKIAGRAPVPGWDATYDWKGYLGFEDLPRVVDPPAGAIGTANASIVGLDYPHHLTYDWESQHRQQRIKELILERDGHDIASMRAAQADVLSSAIAQLQAPMIAAAQAGGADAAVLDQLTAWDATMRADAPEPLIFTAWLRETIRAIYRDDLGGAFDRYFDTRALALLRLLEGRATAATGATTARPRRGKAAAMYSLRRWLPRSRTSSGGMAWTARNGPGERRTMPMASTGRSECSPASARISMSRCRARGTAIPSTAARPSSARARRSPTGTPRATAPSTISPISTARSTSTPPASPATRSRPSTARSPSAGPKSNTSRSPPSAMPSPRRPSAPGA